MKNVKNGSWSISKTETFWKEIAPGEHVLQIYEDTEVFINTLAAFVGTGINAGESVVIIADPQHSRLLEEKLKEHVVHLETLVSGNRFIVQNAEDTLKEFMVDGFPDQEKFIESISATISRARGTENRKVRAFGEMVALLWDRGDREATLRLEQFWDRLCKKEKISLFCAYPRDIFNGPLHKHIGHICNSHSKIIRDTEKPLTEVMYQEVVKKAG